MIREGVLNITADTETQRNAFLHANFGTDVEMDDPTDIESITDEQLEELLAKARVEYKSYKPPETNLQCTFNYTKPKTRGIGFIKFR